MEQSLPCSTPEQLEEKNSKQIVWPKDCSTDETSPEGTPTQDLNQLKSSKQQKYNENEEIKLKELKSAQEQLLEQDEENQKQQSCAQQSRSASEHEYYDEYGDDYGEQIPQEDLFEGEIDDDYLNNALFHSAKTQGIRNSLRSAVRPGTQKFSNTVLQGAVKGSKQKKKQRRTDRYETAIKWGKKTHKVTFADVVEQKPIAQVFEVESFKKLNRFETMEQQACCFIF